jgi:hypothetical protein
LWDISEIVIFSHAFVLVEINDPGNSYSEIQGNDSPIPGIPYSEILEFPDELLIPESY